MDTFIKQNVVKCYKPEPNILKILPIILSSTLQEINQGSISGYNYSW